MFPSVIPQTPVYSSLRGSACTPDGGFLYVANKSINYIGNVQDLPRGTSPVIKIFHTRQSVNSIDVDPRWGEDDNKFFAVLAQDRTVQVWNADAGYAVMGHRVHEQKNRDPHRARRKSFLGPVVMSFQCNGNILSIDGRDIVVFCTSSNTYQRNAVGWDLRKEHVCVLLCSPYNQKIFAVGTNRGLIITYDLEKNMVLYTHRSESIDIVDLGWMKIPGPKTIDKSSDRNDEASKIKGTEQKEKAGHINAVDLSSQDDIFDIYDYGYLENEFGATVTNKSNDSTIDDGTDNYMAVGVEKSMAESSGASSKFDFVEACRNLKEDMTARQRSNSEPDQTDVVVTLADCQQVKRQSDTSSCDTEDATERSLNFSRHSSSDESVDVDGLIVNRENKVVFKVEALNKPETEEENPKPTKPDEVINGKQNDSETIVHQAEVHANHSGDEVKAEAGIRNASGDIPQAEDKQNLMGLQTASEEEQDEEIIVLASASSCGVISIWNFKTGGLYQTLYMNESGTKNFRTRGPMLPIKLHWLNDRNLMVLNEKHHFACWSLENSEPEIGPGGRILQNFKSAKKFLMDDALSFAVSQNNSLIWFVNVNGMIVCYDLLAHKTLATYSHIPADTTALRQCDHNMNKIMFAFTNIRLGVLDVNQLGPTQIRTQNIDLRLQGVVTAIAWSPNGSYCAYGTEEGNVVAFSMEVEKIVPFMFKTMCSRKIYSMDWGDGYIYVVANQMLIAYSDDLRHADGQILFANQEITTVSSRGSLLFMGNQRGHVLLVERIATEPQQPLAYRPLQDLKVLSRYVTQISWSSVNTNRCVVVGSDNFIHVLNFDDKNQKLTIIRSFKTTPVKMTFCGASWSTSDPNRFVTCDFNGLVRVWDVNAEGNKPIFVKQFPCQVNGVVFLPGSRDVIACTGKFISIEFVEVLADNSDEVIRDPKWTKLNALDCIRWATKARSNEEKRISMAVMARRGLPIDKGIACNDETEEEGKGEDSKEIDKKSEKSPANGDLIDDVAVQVSDKSGSTESPKVTESEQEPTTELKPEPEQEIKAEPKPVEEIKAVPPQETEVKEEGAATDQLTDLTVPYKMNIQVTNFKSKKLTAVKKVKGNEELVEDIMKNPATIFHLSSRELTRNALAKMQTLLATTKTREWSRDSLNAKLFGSKAHAKELLQIELNNNKHSNNCGVSSLFMPQLNETLREEIKKRTEAKELTEWHVSLAPCISFNFWQKCCLAYAEQLVESGFALHAATYMIAIRSVDKALKMLMDKNYYREALLVARIYLQSDDPLMGKIIEEWIKHLESCGQLHGAAYLSVLSGQIDRAYEILGKQREKTKDVDDVLELLKKSPKFTLAVCPVPSTEVVEK